jgi:hypothetical protein
MPEPQPISLGNISQGIPLFRLTFGEDDALLGYLGLQSLEALLEGV